MLENLTDLTLYTNDIIELTTQEIINKYCEYSFTSFNEKILVLAFIIILYEIINFIIGFTKFDKLKNIFKRIDYQLNIISKIFILFLSYIVIIKVYPQYDFIFNYLSGLFIIFLIILMYQERKKIKKFMNKFTKTL